MQIWNFLKTLQHFLKPKTQCWGLPHAEHTKSFLLTPPKQIIQSTENKSYRLPSCELQKKTITVINFYEFHFYVYFTTVNLCRYKNIYMYIYMNV